MRQLLTLCVADGLDGLLSVILPRLPSQRFDVIVPALFFLAAEHDSVGCLETMWEVLIKNAGNNDLKTRVSTSIPPCAPCLTCPPLLTPEAISSA